MDIEGLSSDSSSDSSSDLCIVSPHGTPTPTNIVAQPTTPHVSPRSPRGLGTSPPITTESQPTSDGQCVSKDKPVPHQGHDAAWEWGVDITNGKRKKQKRSFNDKMAPLDVRTWGPHPKDDKNMTIEAHLSLFNEGDIKRLAKAWGFRTSVKVKTVKGGAVTKYHSKKDAYAFSKE